LLQLSYHGQKPLTPEVHAPLAAWVKAGGILVVWDDDSDPYNAVREWWNAGDPKSLTPRQQLFEALGLDRNARPGIHRIGNGRLFWEKDNPAEVAARPDGDTQLIARLKMASEGTELRWSEKAHLQLRRGPYLIVGGPDKAGSPKGQSADPGQWQIKGRFINLFDAELRVQQSAQGGPGSRLLLLDLDRVKTKDPVVLASACKALPVSTSGSSGKWMVEGIANTQAIVLLRTTKPVRKITLASDVLTPVQTDHSNQLLWLKFTNTSSPRELALDF